MELSKRLQAVADMVTKGNAVADVGCDHGYVSIYLMQQKICPHVIAMDVNQGPLLRAKEHIAQYCMTDYIETRLSDGVTALNIGEADTLICAGMGGRLTMRILEHGKDVTSAMKEWILQPQSEIQCVREYIRERGFVICDEKMIYEEGKYYPIMKVSLSGGPVNSTIAEIDKAENSADLLHRELADKFGPILLQRKDAVLYDFLLEQQAQYEAILNALQQAVEQDKKQETDNTTDRRWRRMTEVEEELKSIRLAIGGIL